MSKLRKYGRRSPVIIAARLIARAVDPVSNGPFFVGKAHALLADGKLVAGFGWAVPA
ncbi:hypothetical protein [Labrys neptuniae]